ncbi:MAG TPA: PadR family transcriptional regulator [Acidimicrobiales bacterium]
MRSPSLTPTSYVVLGLVGALGPCTSYEMKRFVSVSIGYFWPFPHSQLYAEPVRLAELGLLSEQQETTGRRRRTYVLTAAGREALQDWLSEPNDEPTEIRDLSILKLFFGAQSDERDVRTIAAHARDAHQRRLEEYEAIAASPAIELHQRQTLEMGLRYERAAIDFWQDVLDETQALPS